MKFRLLIISLILLLSSSLFAQGLGSLGFIHELGEKEQATFGDAVKFMVIVMDKRSVNFKRDLRILNKNGITSGYSNNKNTPLRKGAVARMAARYLKLNDSFMYKIFGTERYAFRACVAADIMVQNGSEWDRISGEELIEIMRRVSEKSGGE